MGLEYFPSSVVQDRGKKCGIFSKLLCTDAAGEIKCAPCLSPSSFVPVLPSDGRWRWIVLIASFIINCIVDGICFCFGAFYVELLTTFRESSSKTKLVVSLPSAVVLLSGPIVALLTRIFGCRTVTVAGSIIASAAIFAGSYSTSLNTLFIAHGIIAGLGFGMMFLPSVVAVSFYFEKWRALAITVALSGSAIGPFAFAPVARFLLGCYGWAGANQILAGVVLNGCVCGLLFRPLVLSSTVRSRDTISLTSHGYSSEVSSDDSVVWNVPRSHIMRKLVAAKRLQRAMSTGSLDGMIITYGNHLICPTDLPVIAQSSASPARSERSCVVVLNNNESSFSNSNEMQRSSFVHVGADHERIVLVTDCEQLSGSSSIWKLQHSAVEVGDSKHYASEKSTDSQVSFVDDCSPAHVEEIIHKPNELWTPTSYALCSETPEGKDSQLCDDMNNSRTVCGIMAVIESDAASKITRPLVSSLKSPDSVRRPSQSLPSVTAKYESVLMSLISVVLNLFGLTLFKSAVFPMLCFGSFLPFIGYFVPYTFLLPYAMEEESISQNGPRYLVYVLGVSNFVGRLIAGLVANQSWSDPVSLYSSALIIGGLFTCVLPLLHAFELLCVYAGVTGICNAFFVTLMPVVIIELMGLEQLTSAFGLLCLLHGMALLLGSPFTTLIFDTSDSFTATFLVAGCMIALCGGIFLPIRRVVRWEKRRFCAELKEDCSQKSSTRN